MQFDSVFESGNLAIALKVSENEYNCIFKTKLGQFSIIFGAEVDAVEIENG